MDTAVMKESLSDLTAMFLEKMDSFEGKLAKTSSPSPSLEALTAEYNTFKQFILKSLRALQTQIEQLASVVDQQEMRMRRKILLFHGLPEVTKENTADIVANTIIERLKHTTFTSSLITQCQRMGRGGVTDKPRPILCRFKDVDVRDRVWASKTSLKGSGISVSEFLTKARHDIFLAARQHFGITKCWTRDGYIYVLGSDGNRHRISCLGELKVLQQKAQPKAAQATKERAPSKTRKTSRK